LLVFHRSLASGRADYYRRVRVKFGASLDNKKNWGEYLVVRRRIAAQRERTPPARERE